MNLYDESENIEGAYARFGLPKAYTPAGYLPPSRLTLLTRPVPRQSSRIVLRVASAADDGAYRSAFHARGVYVLQPLEAKHPVTPFECTAFVFHEPVFAEEAARYTLFGCQSIELRDFEYFVEGLKDGALRCRVRAELLSGYLTGHEVAHVGEVRRRAQLSYFTQDVYVANHAFDTRSRLLNMAHDYPQVADDHQWGPERLFMSLLTQTAPKGDVLEIGVGMGGSLGALGLGARSDAHVFGVDNWSYGYEGAREAALHVAGRVGAIVVDGDSAAVAGTLPDQLAVLHIDGDHSYEGCLRDLQTYAPRVVRDGVLFLDDYGTLVDMPGVHRAWWDFVASRPEDEWFPICAGPKLAAWRRREA